MARTFPFRFHHLTAKLAIWLLIGSFFAVTGSFAFAQSQPLEAGDVLSIIVQRHAEMSSDEVIINSAGKARFPGIGEVQVAGKTVEQVGRQLTKILDAELVRPDVTVTLKRSHPRPVSVLGAVSRPGIYEASPGWRITELLSTAGGLSAKPEAVSGSLTKRDGQVVSLDVPQIIGELQPGNTSTSNKANFALQGGEVLRFWVRTVKISVAGQVQRPGTFEATEGTKLLDAIALAGGALPRAALSKTVITRADGTTATVNLLQTMLSGNQENNVKLTSGDLITVPEAKDRVTVRGAVQRPGYYDIEDGATLRVAQAIALAGGTLPRAALTRVRVEHADGSADTVNLFKVMTLGERTADKELTSGDVVTVPESRGITVLGEVPKPGNYPFEEGAAPRVSDVLAEAGGITGKNQEVSITLTRNAADGQMVRLNVDPIALIEGRGEQQNIAVLDGDLITVASQRTQSVIISGEVKTPGVYELKAGSSLPELLARAGGPTEDAALRQVSITGRDNNTRIVDGFTALQKGGETLNAPLQDGDFVVIPKNTSRVLVLPAVNKPGYYPIPEGEPMTVGKALALAGGPKERARLKEVAIFRQTNAGVKSQIIALDRAASAMQALDIPLQNGDVLYVPEGKQSTSAWSSISNALSGLGVFAAIF